MNLHALRRWERVFYAVILVLAVFSRFYLLEDRAISHDESIHTKFAWNLYAGQGFQHNPMMHGPLLFELTALSYFVFGPNDFSARFVTALVGVALVLAPLLFRKWLGRTGAAMAAVLLLISPSISYYSRYIRHDVLLMLAAVLWLWTILRYLDTGQTRWLYALAACFSVMYATKEASYIYTAIFGALLFLPFAWQVFATRWRENELFTVFALMLVGALLLGAVFGLSFLRGQMEEKTLDDAGHTRMANVAVPWWGRVAVGLAFLLLLGSLVVCYYGVGAEAMREIRLFDVLMVVGTLTLPLGSAFLVKFVAGVDMGGIYDAVVSGNLASLPAATTASVLGIVGLSILISVALGLWWGPKRWPVVAAIHYAIFFVLYTTIFTWGYGALSGLVGGLAYWMAQQGVKRGGQPDYYYFLIGPLYEYLVLLFSVVGGAGAVAHFVRRWRAAKPAPANATPDVSPDLANEAVAAESDDEVVPPPTLDLPGLFPLFLLGWVLLSWAGYTYAGEKMPWLLVHITLPSVFLGAWALGRLADGLDVKALWNRRGAALVISLPLAAAALAVFSRSASALIHALRDGVGPAGPSLVQLEPFGRTLGGGLGLLAFGGVFVWASGRFRLGQVARAVALVAAAFLALLTVRTMALLNFVNYDLATEFLVYAHGTPDIKVALEQIEEVSWRVTGAPHDVRVAFGEDGSWPLYWYMVDYPNHYFYSTSPDPATLLECPVIIAGSPQYGAVEEIVGDDYLVFDYKYLWWPIQDYYGLTWERVRGALADPAMRAALWDIIWDRDYAYYARLKNPEDPFTLQTWPYRKEFRLYVREDLARDIWTYRVGEAGPRVVRPQPTEPPDPYVAGERALPLASGATLAGASPRGLALAPDGTLYVADTAGHKIWHITPQGEVLNSFGEYGVGPGQFNEPGDVALDAEGNLYVADTWNHRVQKFSPQGVFITSWGTPAQMGEMGGFFGPRAVVVGPEGEVFVADTGNKRVQVFDAEGTPLREFGGAGAAMGQMDEPVGLAISAAGELYVADTWNRRVQVFTLEGAFVRQWRVPSWGSDNPEEKPYLAVDGERVYVGDPVHGRVLVFDAEGAFQWALASGESAVRLAFPAGVAVGDGVLYVADAHGSQVLGYALPER